MKRGQIKGFVIIGLVILILLINGNVNADKKECEKAVGLAEQSALRNIQGYKGDLERGNKLLKNLQSKNLDIIERNLPYIKDNPEKLASVRERLEIMNKLEPKNTKITEQLKIVKGELNKFLIPKASEIKGLKEGDLLHGTPQKNLLSILNSGYLKVSREGAQGEGVYVAQVLKEQTAAIGITRRVKPGEVPILFKIEKKNLDPSTIKVKKMDFQGKITKDILLKDIEIYDPIKKEWFNLEYVNKNKDKFKYLF